MKRVFTLVGACLAISLVLTPAAGAEVTATQTEQSSAALAENAPLPPAYVLERDGTVINEGDMVTDCKSFLSTRTPGFSDTRNKAEARMVADKCRDLGVPSDFGTGNSEIVLSLGTTGPPASGTGKLPDTGGISLTSLAGLASGLALICGGLLLRRRRS